MRRRSRSWWPTRVRHEIAVCGPNCVGVVNLHAQAATYSVALPSTLRRGHVGAVLQSGAVCLGIANSNRGLGFSTLISSGNEAVLDNADYIAYLADDPDTEVIIAFIEGFKSPDKFIWAAGEGACGGQAAAGGQGRPLGGCPARDDGAHRQPGRGRRGA